MLSMLGVIRPSLAGRSMMVLLQEDAGLCIGPNIKRPRSGRDLKVRRSCDGAPLRRFARSFRCRQLLLVGLRRSFTASLFTFVGHAPRTDRTSRAAMIGVRALTVCAILGVGLLAAALHAQTTGISFEDIA